MRKGKRNTFLYRFLKSYIMIISVSLALFILISWETVYILEEQVKQSNLMMLEQSRDIIDRHVQELNGIIERVALDPAIVSLANIDGLREGTPDIDLLIRAVDSLSAYRLPDSFIKDLYVYFRNSDIIMTSSRGATSMRLMYGNYFRFGAMSYDAWRAQTVGGVHMKSCLPETPVTIGGRQAPVITLMQTLPVDYPKSNRGCIMAFIDTAAVRQLLQKITTGGEGYTYVLGSDNEIITSIQPDGGAPELPVIPPDRQSGVMNARVAGKDMVVSYTKSSLNQWKYVAVVPAAYMMQKVNSTRLVFLAAALVTLFVGLVLSWVFSYRNAKPIKEVYDSLREFFGDSGPVKDLSFLSTSVVSLIRSNRDLDERLKEHSPTIRAAFLRRLLTGKCRDIGEIRSNFARLDIRLEGEAYCVVMLAISGYRNLINRNILEELDYSRLYINRIIKERTAGRAVCCDIDDTNIAIILSFDTAVEDTVRGEAQRMAAEIHEAIRGALAIEVTFAAGCVCAGLADIAYSYSDARQALAHVPAGQKGRLLWYRDVRDKSGSYWYTLDMEQHVVELVSAGRKDELARFLESVRSMNFEERELSVSMLRLLACQMAGTLSRLSDSLRLDVGEELLSAVLATDDAGAAFDDIAAGFLRLCDAVLLKRDQSDRALCDKILAYIDESYMREDLTLYTVAMRFNLSETYLYHFFKAETGATFACYLEKLRMDRAYSMLKETGIPIGDIALKVGYSNAYSFRRAFKRCRGVIPSELRGLK